MLDAKIANLIACGYRRVSNRYNQIARVDRPNWQEKGCTADEYRRRHARRITLHREEANLVPTSLGDDTGYIPLERCDICRLKWPLSSITFAEVPGKSYAQAQCPGCRS